VLCKELDVIWPELKMYFRNGDATLNLNEALFKKWSDIPGKT